MIFGQPWIEEDEIRAVTEVLRSGWISQGPKVAEFESALAAYLGADQVVAVSSCTSALFLALRSCNLQPGDKVLVPTMTFVATANIVLELGLEVVFADCDPQTLNIVLPDDADVKAVIPVHFAGRPCDMTAINDRAKQKGWRVVEDAAHALGAEYQGRKIGCSENIACFSFYPNKNLTTIEGGALAFSGNQSNELAEEFKRARLHGMNKDAWKRFHASNHGLSLMDTFGFKMNLTDVQAAVGLVQLKKYQEILRRRKLYYQMYGKELQGLPLQLPAAYDSNCEGCYHLFIGIHKDNKRDELREFLSRQEIPTGIHYFPVHQQPFYARKYPDTQCPTAEYIGQNCLSLPLSASMTVEDVERVIAAIWKFYAQRFYAQR